LWTWVPEGHGVSMSPWTWVPEGHGNINHHVIVDLGAWRTWGHQLGCHHGPGHLGIGTSHMMDLGA